MCIKSDKEKDPNKVILLFWFSRTQTLQESVHLWRNWIIFREVYIFTVYVIKKINSNTSIADWFQ